MLKQRVQQSFSEIELPNIVIMKCHGIVHTTYSGVRLTHHPTFIWLLNIYSFNLQLYLILSSFMELKMMYSYLK